MANMSKPWPCAPAGGNGAQIIDINMDEAMLDVRPWRCGFEPDREPDISRVPS
jgi:cobalamin-dependent methionine synthase I